MTSPHGVVFLLDVDNTLLDNDRVHEDFTNRFERDFGPAGRDRYWAIYEQLRTDLGYADYLGALQRFRTHDNGDRRLLEIASFMLDYRFEDRLYAGSIAAIDHVGLIGVPVILSDGDVVYQSHKIRRSGLWDAVAGRVLIYTHKELAFEDVEAHYPASHYVIVDDKLRLLTAMKRIGGSKVTTVLPRQGHYALDPKNIADYPAPDMAIDRIGDLRHFGSGTIRIFGNDHPADVRVL